MPADRTLSEQAARCVQIMSTRTICCVRWGDGTVERGVPGVSLHALEHLGSHDFFPNDFVVEEEGDPELDIMPQASTKPERVGVVLTSNVAHRTCNVHWLAGEETEVATFYDHITLSL